MVLLTTTPEVLHAISLLTHSDLETLNHDTTTSTTTPLPKSTSDPISHNNLIALSRILRSKYSPSPPSGTKSYPAYTLSTLLLNTKPYFAAPPPPPPKTPEFLALQASLLAASEARTYNSLLSPDLQSSHLSVGPEDPSQKQGEDDISPSLVLNIFLSIVLCGFAVWHVTRFWSNDGLRVLCSLGAGIAVGVAEVVVYSAYLRKVDEARKRERKKREVKRLAREVTAGDGGRVRECPGKEIGGADEEGAEEVVVVGKDDGKEELIWGKGTHGGFRRRVREKWEKERDKESKTDAAAAAAAEQEK